MKIAVLSDIHANKVALDAVLDHISNVDRIVCVGDVIGYGPHPAKCVEYLRENKIHVVQGNHDRSVNKPENYDHNEMACEGLKYAKQSLSEEQIDWLLNLPMELEIEDNLWIKHEHPNNDYLDDYKSYVKPRHFPEMNTYLKEKDVNALALGHTHIQHSYIGPYGEVFNPGSVGQPRGNDTRAAYAVYDTDTNRSELQRVQYDIHKVIEDVRATNLPENNGLRLL